MALQVMGNPTGEPRPADHHLEEGEETPAWSEAAAGGRIDRLDLGRLGCGRQALGEKSTGDGAGLEGSRDPLTRQGIVEAGRIPNEEGAPRAGWLPPKCQGPDAIEVPGEARPRSPPGHGGEGREVPGQQIGQTRPAGLHPPVRHDADAGPSVRERVDDAVGAATQEDLSPRARLREAVEVGEEPKPP